MLNVAMVGLGNEFRARLSLRMKGEREKEIGEVNVVVSRALGPASVFWEVWIRGRDCSLFSKSSVNSAG